jgi:hypothetical protein
VHQTLRVQRSDKNSNGCLNRSFANIKELPRLLFQCATLATPRCGPVGKQRAQLRASAVFFIFPNSVGSFSRRFVERAWAKPSQRVIFLQHRIFAFIARTTAEFHLCKFLPLPNAKYLVQTY